MGTIFTILFIIFVPGGIAISLAWHAYKRSKEVDERLVKTLEENIAESERLIKQCEKMGTKADKKDKKK